MTAPQVKTLKPERFILQVLIVLYLVLVLALGSPHVESPAALWFTGKCGLLTVTQFTKV